MGCPGKANVHNAGFSKNLADVGHLFPIQQSAACAGRKTLNVTRKLQNAPTLMESRSASAKVGTSNTTRWTTPAEVLLFVWCILPEFSLKVLFQWK